MAKITIGIHFDRLDNVIYQIESFQKYAKTHDNYNVVKEKMSKENGTKNSEIKQIIREIEYKFGTECEKFCLADNIIEGFFEVYYTEREENVNSEAQLKEILSFLSGLRNKYHNADLRWYVLESTFNNDYFD